MKKLVSIIIPVYKVEKYLRECLDSICRQTYQNLEIILVNDGSPDQCGEICDEYALKDSRIKVIHKKNGGLSSARNVALDIAKGDYISFVDSDDIIDLKFIENMLEILEREQVECVFCAFQRFRDSIDVEYDIKEKQEETLFGREALLEILYQNNDTIFSVAAWNKLYKRDIFEKIRYPEGLINEDLAVIVDVLNEVEKISWTSYVGYYYRVTEASITNQGFNSKRMDCIHILEDIIVKLKHEQYDEKFIKAAYNMLFRRSIEMLMIAWLEKEKYPQEINKLLLLILNNRKLVLQDSNAPKVNKVAAILSYCGFNIFCKSYSMYKKYINYKKVS